MNFTSGLTLTLVLVLTVTHQLIEAKITEEGMEERREGGRENMEEREKGWRDKVEERREGGRDSVEGRRKGWREDLKEGRESVEEREEGWREKVEERREGGRENVEERREEWRENVITGRVEERREDRETVIISGEKKGREREEGRENLMREEEEGGGRRGGGKEDKINHTKELEEKGRRRRGERKTVEEKDSISLRRKKKEEREEEEEEEVAWIWVITSSSSSSSTQQQTTTTTTRQVDRLEGTATNITLEIRTQTRTLTLDVYLNRELLGHTYGGGREERVCDYQGVARGETHSLVAVSVCAGLMGGIYTRGQWEEVFPAPSTHTLSGPHLLSAHTHTHPRGRRGECGVRSDRKQQQQLKDLKRVERSLAGGGEGGGGGDGDYLWIQRNTSYVEVAVVVDSSLREHLISSSTSSSTSSTSEEELIRKRVQAVMNIVNVLYQPLGIIIVLTHIDIWSENEIEVVEGDSNATLTHLKTFLPTLKAALPNTPIDNVQLLTGVTFEGNTVGKGTVGGMCGPSSVGVSMAGKGRSVVGVAETVAHEMGHNFGLSHVDEVEGCQCEERDCIMLSSGMGRRWAECSHKNISRLLQTVAMECLKNHPPHPPLGSCGDGVVEGEEECDCGPPDMCHHNCCVPETCKLAVNATCGSGACCDVQTCEPYPASPHVECRPAYSTCDVAEYCDGWSAECPSDDWWPDGTACEVGKGYCYQGWCGSAWGRCVQVWGKDATPCPSEMTRAYNVLGDRTGNCGYKGSGEEVKACAESDSECGTLFCRTPEDTDALGWFLHRTAWQGPQGCRAVLAHDTYPPKAWLTPDGAACGNGKMCINQQCVSRPTPLSTIIFWVIFVFAALLTLLCWDHLRYCWERKGGRACCHTHLYYCAACLDACCCPCMNKLNRLVLSVMPPLLLPKCTCHKPHSRGSDKAGNGEVGNGEVVCNGSTPGDVLGGARRPGEGRNVKKKEEEEEEEVWGMDGLVQFAPKGVTLRPISHPPGPRPPTHMPQGEVPLLAPLQDPPQPPQGQESADNGQFSTDINLELSDLDPDTHAHTHAHTHIAPVRPAPPPPAAHTDAHRPPPSIPPRPVITHPLRPPLTPPKPASPPQPPLASFPPPIKPYQGPKPPLPPKP